MSANKALFKNPCCTIGFDPAGARRSGSTLLVSRRNSTQTQNNSSRKITNCGVKPIDIEQWQRENDYLYGIVEPKSGDRFFYEFSHLDHICFEQFLKLVSQEFSDSLNIIQLHNSGAHTAGDITISNNILLVFQANRAAELNPIERVWQYLKDDLAWMRYDTLENLRLDVPDLLSHLCRETISSITGYWFILSALSVAGIN